MHAFDPPLFHLDLKPGNVLIDAKHNDVPSKWSARVADFGSSQIKSNVFDALPEGTCMFMSPEMLSAEEPTHLSDVYAFGMLMSSQVSHDACPADVVTLPTAHVVHEVARNLLLIVPALHNWHGEYPSMLYCPCPHLILSTHFPFNGACPSEQATQLLFESVIFGI